MLADHWKFWINTAFLVLVNRERARRPSLDQANEEILSDVKWVTAFGGPPAIACCQMLPTPLNVLTKEMLRPSGVQTNGPSDVAGSGKNFEGEPPAKGSNARLTG
jgi:hypothetical protein